MKNPLNQRLPREFWGEIGKYLVIFLFMTATIGFVSGFLVAGDSMIKAYDESFEKYNIEDGNFELQEEADKELIEELEDISLKITGEDDEIRENGVTILPQFYVEEETDHDLDGETDSTLRIFENRKEVNQVCLMEGRLPKEDREIAIDRMYADNNGIKVGDELEAGEKRLTVTGLVALSDYSALFSDNGDMMFDSIKFGVGIMTKDGFDNFGEKHLHYGYTWKYDKEPEDDIEEKKFSDVLMEELSERTVTKDFIPRYINQAIQFTGDDMGGDRTLMLVLLYILIGILAFVFAVTTNHTIAKEAAVIGTLRASGYTKGEMIGHYLAMPLFITLLAAIAGNVLGYTVFKNIVVDMYYGSYSLPTYETIWNGEAFVLTTIVPLFIMMVANIWILTYRLSFSPLQFIRRDLKRKKDQKAIELPEFKFFHRFRLRIIFQNRSAYITLFVGIVFSYILLLFGMMMGPMFSRYEKEVVENMIADYQYILKYPVEAENDHAEKFAMTSMKYRKENGEGEEISIYGIVENSSYIDVPMPDEGVFISDGFAEKYKLETGDMLTLRESFGRKEYAFKIMGIYDYPAALTVFMSIDEFCDVFDKEEGYFNGYFSNEKLEKIDEIYVASCITEEDYTKVTRQLNVSMGAMFDMINVFAVILFALLIYLLTKLILEKNIHVISMVKILGYKNGEIARLYLLATTGVIIISILLSMVIATKFMEQIFIVMMKDFSGWFSMYIAPKTYGEMFVMGMAAYLVVALLQVGKIQKIPMDEALKNME